MFKAQLHALPRDEAAAAAKGIARRTDKARMRVEAIPEQLTGEQLLFAQEAAHDASPLVPSLWNHFTRYLLFLQMIEHLVYTVSGGMLRCCCAGVRQHASPPLLSV